MRGKAMMIAENGSAALGGWGGSPHPKTVEMSVRATARSSGVRLQGPDLLRACAILLVMLLHTRGEAAPGILGIVRPYAWLGVDILFVLSGYLVGSQLLARIASGKRPALLTFYLSRAFRILPAFFAVLALYYILPIIREAPDLPSIWRYLTFTLNFGLDFTWAFTHAWSLCVEEHFYLLFPIAVLALARIGKPIIAIALAMALIIGGMVLRVAIWERWIAPLLAGARYDDLMPVYMRVLYYPSYARTDGLLLGVSLAALRTFYGARWAEVMPARRALPAGMVITALAISLIGWRGELQPVDAPIVVQTLIGTTLSFPLIALGVALILSGLIDSEPALARYPVPGAATVAAISYSLYLTHKAVMNVDRLVFGEVNLIGIIGLIVYYGTSLGVAWTLWRFVEQPFLTLRGRLASRPQ